MRGGWLMVNVFRGCSISIIFLLKAVMRLLQLVNMTKNVYTHTVKLKGWSQVK